jgi:hypothetical protein
MILTCRDNGANIVKGVNDANLRSAGCFAHTLQLVYHKSIKKQASVNELVSKSRNIVSKFNRSSKNSTLLHDKQVEQNISPRKLIQDVATRWNSTYYMLERLYQLKSVIGSLSTDIDFENLSANEWNILPGVLALLKPLEEVTKMISREDCIISEVITNVSTLIKYYSKPDGSNAGFKTLKKEFLSCMQRRFQKMHEKNDYAFATCLDPRFKLAFFSEVHRERIKVEIKKLILDLEIKPETVVRPSASLAEEAQHAGMLNFSLDSSEGRSAEQQNLQGALGISDHTHVSFWSCFDEALQEGCADGAVSDDQSSIRTTETKKLAIEAEVNLYWSLPPISYVSLNVPNGKEHRLMSDHRAWWRTQKHRLPTLQKYALKHLSAPATSVYSERIFSEAGQIYDNFCLRMTPENAESLLFVKRNLPLLQFQY